MSKVILLFGGTSEERLVSVASAQNLAEQFSFDELVFQDKNENLYKVEKSQLASHQNVFTVEFKPSSSVFAASISEAISYFKDKTVFMGFHGSQGESGEVQALFEQHRVCFTGSGAEASRLAFEKKMAKEVLSNTEHLLPEEMSLSAGQIESKKDKVFSFFGKHKKIVFKPVASGSSFGLHIVETREQLETAMAEIKKSDYADYLVENFIQGRELTVGVTQIGEELVALPASEVILNPGNSFDYQGKYMGKGATEVTPAQIDETQMALAQKLAVDAHLALGCFGYSRTDMILSDKGPYFLETNTLPGLSKPSFFPQQLNAAGMNVKDFIRDQINLAEKRYI